MRNRSRNGGCLANSSCDIKLVQSGGASGLWHGRYRRNRRWLCTRNSPLVRQRSRLSAQDGSFSSESFIVQAALVQLIHFASLVL